VLERHARRVMLLSFLVLMGGSAVWAGGPVAISAGEVWPAAVPTTRDEAPLYHHGEAFAGVATELLEPPMDIAQESALSSPSLRSLPTVPRPLLMAVVGFLCISLVRDRRVWLTVAASVFSFGQHWLDAVPAWCHAPRSRRQLQQSAVAAALPLLRLRTAFCICTQSRAARNLNQKRETDREPVTIVWPQVSDRLRRSFASTVEVATSPLSQLEFAQLARGPPAGAWDKMHCQPSADGGSMRARPFNREGGYSGSVLNFRRIAMT